MKTVKILGDTLNKVADTSTIFDFRLWNGGQAQDVAGKAVSFVIANDSGYLFDVPAVVDGNVISLDFSNELLKQLTPDTYHMEVSVANADGDVEVYPSEGAIDFTMGKNLHSTQGKLVPQITFDTVLRSVDEKIAEYRRTITKGDKGDTGPQGPKGDMDLSQITVGGRNLYLNSRALADYTPNGGVTVTKEPFDSTTNMWHIVASQGSGSGVGIYIVNYAVGKIPNNSDWSYSADIKGTGKVALFGIEASDKSPIKGTIGSDWSRISQTGHVYAPTYKTIVMYFDTTNSPLDVYIKLPKLETGNLPTDWTPAPEDADSTYVKDTRRASGVTDFNVVMGKTWSGKWYKAGVHWSNEPTGASNYLQFEYSPGDNDHSGILEIRDWTQNRHWVRTLSGGTWSNWVELANDSNVVHKTGTETIAGDKTFTGNTTLTTTTILAGNYGLRVTSSGFQKTTDGKTWVSANI